jgi:hypothetical protein
MIVLQKDIAITHVRLCSWTTPGVGLKTLSVSDDPTKLDYSPLTRCAGWFIQAKLENGAIEQLVTCDWRGGLGYIAHGTYILGDDTQDVIETHAAIIPYVQQWLKQPLYGRHITAFQTVCPRLEIFVRSA